MSEVLPPSSPYQGLAAFEDSAVDALLFFGRDRDSQVIAANLMASRLTVLFGPTGVGKTSVLRAGVAYKLRQEAGVDVRVHSSWIGDPGEALADLAPKTGRDLYLMLDQFEEFFLYHEGDRTFVEELVDVLRRADLRVNVLIGIREDALALLDAFKAVIPNLLSNRLRLENLDRAAGEAAIRGPLSRFNELVPAGRRVDLEQSLVGAVLDEVAAGRVDLGGVGRGVVTFSSEDDRIEAPYLQLVMSRLWEVEAERGSQVLRRGTLAELGGATQIVEDHLGHAMADLSPRQKDAAAAMYNFLVTPSGSKIAHRTSDLAGYAEIDEEMAGDVLRLLAAERIIRASSDNGAGTRYEIYHDVLADAVAGWGNRYRAERALRNAERHRRRALLVAVGALIGLVLVAAVAVFALVERRHSRADARRAQARELAASAGRAQQTNPQKSLSLALQAAELEQGPDEEDVLRGALLTANERAVMRAGAPVRLARFDPAGRRIATGSQDGKVRVYRIGSTRPETVMSQGRSVTALEYSPDGQILLTAGRDGTARIWSSAGVFKRRLKAGGAVRSASFAGGSRSVLTLADGGVIRFWRTRDGELLRTIRANGVAVPKRAAVDPSGRFVATVARDRFARLYSLETGRLLRLLPQSGLVHCVAFDPSGSLLLTCGHAGVARVWSVPSGRLVRNLRGPGPKSPPLEGVFAPNGILVGAGVADNTARVWEATTGFQVGTTFGHTAPVTHVAFSPTGRSLVTGALDNTARTWVVNGRPVAVLSGHKGPLNSVEFSPDGRHVVTASDDGTARLWDSETEPELALMAKQAPITAFAISPDGKSVLVGGADGVARVRAVGRSHVREVLRKDGPITAVAFGPHGPIAVSRPTLSMAVRDDWIARGQTDGSVIIDEAGHQRRVATGAGPVTAVAFDAHHAQLATGSAAGVVTVWNLQNGRKLATLVADRFRITSVAFLPGGRRLLTASFDHEARSWNLNTRRPEQIRRWHVGPLGSAAYSRDGRWVVTAGPSTAAVGKASEEQHVLVLHGPKAMRPLVGAAFAGTDGHLIVVASKDGTIRTYRCEICGSIGDLIAAAKRRLSLR
jgi:WD40 repeat protein